MTRLIRFFLALCALVLCGGALAACGNSVPSDSIATVGGVSISKAAFNHWLNVAVKSNAATSAPGSAVAPLDPPNYAQCVAFHQQHDPPPPKGTPNPTPASIKAQCVQLYGAARDQVVPFLITADWLQGEAADQGVKVTDAEVQTGLKTALAGKTPAQIQQFMTQSGETNADLLFRVRINTLSNKLRTKVTSTKTTITPADIMAYYNKNIAQFSKPETRDLRIVLVKSPALAHRVLALIKSGQSISRLARQFSVDQATKTNGGALLQVTRGTQDRALDAAIFSAKVGQVVGPVKTPFGYEVFRLQKITPASKQTLAQATPLVRQLIAAQRQQTTLAAFVAKFMAKWKSRTTCASGYIVAPDCKNAPKNAKTTPTTPTTTGAPNGQ